jgi:hypothetical protein
MFIPGSEHRLPLCPRRMFDIDSHSEHALVRVPVGTNGTGKKPPASSERNEGRSSSF